MKIERENKKKNKPGYVCWMRKQEKANNEELETRNVYNSMRKEYTRKEIACKIRFNTQFGWRREREKNYNDLGRNYYERHRGTTTAIVVISSFFPFILILVPCFFLVILQTTSPAIHSTACNTHIKATSIATTTCIYYSKSNSNLFYCNSAIKLH